MNVSLLASNTINNETVEKAMEYVSIETSSLYTASIPSPGGQDHPNLHSLHPHVTVFEDIGNVPMKRTFNGKSD